MTCAVYRYHQLADLCCPRLLYDATWCPVLLTVAAWWPVLLSDTTCWSMLYAVVVWCHLMCCVAYSCSLMTCAVLRYYWILSADLCCPQLLCDATWGQLTFFDAPFYKGKKFLDVDALWCFMMLRMLWCYIFFCHFWLQDTSRFLGVWSYVWACLHTHLALLTKL